MIRWLLSPWSILSVALALRLLWWFLYAPWENEFHRLIAHAPNPDSGSYHKVALALLHHWNRPGRALVEMPDAAASISIRPPGYPLLIAMVYAIAGVRPAWVLLAQVFISVAGGYFLMQALRNIQGAAGAAIGGWLYALNPTLIDYTCLILTETQFVLGTTLVIYALSVWRTASRPAPLPMGFWIGVAIAFTALTRPSPIPLIPVLALLGAWARPLEWRQRGLFWAGYLLGILVLFVPWSVYNRVHYGSWRLTIGGEQYLLDQVGLVVGRMERPLHEMRAVLTEQALAQMQRDGLDPVRQVFERGRYYRAVALRHLQEDPANFVRYWLRGMVLFWRSAGGANSWGADRAWVKGWFQLYHVVYLLLVGVGLWAAFRTAALRWWAWLFVLTALYFTMSAFCSGNPRFRLQTFAFSMPVAVSGGLLVGHSCLNSRFLQGKHPQSGV